MFDKFKGIVLAGGSGTRLKPVTDFTCKQLLPIYNKPLVYYPLTTLLDASIDDILVISTPEATPVLEKALGNGREYGARFSYAVQEKPRGIAEALVIGEKFLGDSAVCLILGDNIFHGEGFGRALSDAMESGKNTVFGYAVSNPGRYGVADFDMDGRLLGIEEKPRFPRSAYAITGMYVYKPGISALAKSLKPSKRHELEITDLNNALIGLGDLGIRLVGSGNAWLDAGTFESMNDASNYVRTMEERTTTRVGDLGKHRLKNNARATG